MNILVLATGSIAVKKLPQVIFQLKQRQPQAQVRVVATPSAKALAIDNAETPEDLLYFSEILADERLSQTKCFHIEIMKWADICVILPLSANTMSKVAAGICDNFLLCILRAWPFGPNHLIEKPILAFPAMNTNMWNHPVTKEAMMKLIAWGWQIVNPIVKHLACGDVGIGALPEVPDVTDRICQHLNEIVIRKGVCVSKNESGGSNSGE